MLNIYNGTIKLISQQNVGLQLPQNDSLSRTLRQIFQITTRDRNRSSRDARTGSSIPNIEQHGRLLKGNKNRKRVMDKSAAMRDGPRNQFRYSAAQLFSPDS